MANLETVTHTHIINKDAEIYYLSYHYEFDNSGIPSTNMFFYYAIRIPFDSFEEGTNVHATGDIFYRNGPFYEVIDGEKVGYIRSDDIYELVAE